MRLKMSFIRTERQALTKFSPFTTGKSVDKIKIRIFGNHFTVKNQLDGVFTRPRYVIKHRFRKGLRDAEFIEIGNEITGFRTGESNKVL